MSGFDLVLTGGRMVEAEAVWRQDLAIRDGRVAAWLAPGEPATATRAIDVTGALLLPGLVDAHVHLRQPGLTWKEDFASGTRAAIAGGVTTVLVMPTDDPWTDSVATLAAKRALAEGRVFADVGLQVAVRRGADVASLAALAGLGATSFEVFTADVPPAYRHASPADLRAAAAAVRAAGGIIAASPGEDSLLSAALARLSPGRSTPADFARSRSGQAEAIGIANAVLTSEAVAAPIHIRQSNSREGMATFRALRDRAAVSIETSPQCLLFTAADYARFGPAAKASPPWRTPADRDAVRAALADGVIDMVVSDHAPHQMAEKLAAADDFAAVPGGFSGVQTLLFTLLALVAEGLIGLPDLVRVASRRPAEVFGLGARKGRLRPGFDADIVVLDPAGETTIRRADQLSKCDFTPFEGLRVPFGLRGVFLRGAEVWAPAGVATQPRGRVVAPEG